MEKLFSKKHDFEWEQFCEKHDSEIELFRLARFLIEILSFCQISNQLFCNASDFELNILQRVIFWMYVFCRSLPNFHAFMKTGHVSVII